MFNSSIKQRYFSLFLARLFSLAVQVSKVATNVLAWRIFHGEFSRKTAVYLGNTMNLPHKCPLNGNWQLSVSSWHKEKMASILFSCPVSHPVTCIYIAITDVSNFTFPGKLNVHSEWSVWTRSPFVVPYKSMILLTANQNRFFSLTSKEYIKFLIYSHS